MALLFICQCRGTALQSEWLCCSPANAVVLPCRVNAACLVLLLFSAVQQSVLLSIRLTKDLVALLIYRLLQMCRVVY